MKKGFTLIELLAVIIILSIISLITTIAVNSTISDSKDQLLNAQINKIEESAEAFYLKEGMNKNVTCVNLRALIQRGYIEGDSVKDPKTREEMTGSVKITYASNQYSYEYQDKFCEQVCEFTTNHEGVEMVTCGIESFYVMKKTTDEVTMLAQYNLSTTTPLQDSTDTEYSSKNPVRFSNTNYWSNGGYSPAGNSSYNYVYDSNSTINAYLSAYGDELEGFGVTVLSTRLMSYEEAISFGCSENSCASARQWVYQTSYWLGSALDNLDVWHISSDTSFNADGFDYNSEYGIRPVITIPINNVKTS